MAAKRSKTGKKKPIKADLWTCNDLKALIKERIDTHVKDVAVAKRLERALADEIAYGDGGGGGNVGVA